MPARILWPLLAFVLAAHALLLLGLPLPVGTASLPPALAMHTRVLPPPEPPPPPPAPPPAQPPAAPAASPVPRAKPRPAAAPRKAARPPAAVVAAAPRVESVTGSTEDASQSLAAATEYDDWLAQLAARPEPAAAVATPAHGANAPTQAQAADPPPAEPAPATPPPAAPAPEPAHLAAVPPAAMLSFEAHGRVKGFNYHASAELAWLPEGEHYVARQKVSAFLLGSRSQESSGTLGPGGLRPERFVDQFRKARTAQFDRTTHQVHFSDGASATAPLTDDAQDRLSVFFQLGALLAADPARYPPGTRIAFDTVGARRVDRWVFSVEGAEVLDLPAGPTATLRLQRVHEDASSQKDELWLGTDLHYLPVRIRLAQDEGDYADLTLTGHETP